MAWMKHHFYVKVLISISISIVVFCVISNLVIATLFGQQLVKKSRAINQEYGSVVWSYLEETSESLDILGLLIENNSNIRWALSQRSLNTTASKKYALAAQESLEAYLNASSLADYIKIMAAVNTDLVLISSTSAQQVKASQVFSSPLFLQEQEKYRSHAMITPSVSGDGQYVLAYLYPISTNLDRYVYLELDDRILTQPLEVYRDSADLLIRSTGTYPQVWYSSPGFQNRYQQGEIKPQEYLLDTLAFPAFQLSVQVFTSSLPYSTDNAYLITMLLVVCLTVICVGISVSRLISRRISKPLNLLSSHIMRLTDEDHLTVNPEIEQGEDEIAQIGRVLNRLVRHINDLIRRQKEMYEQKQRLEINALQAQINPHFLYNTLDSIRWMAVIQKSTSIAGTVMSLENLLRNMAKGAGEKIPLGKELSLVQDYVNLQQVRYMEIFDYVCQIPEKYMKYQIVKMTIQPIVENAILHGIEPTGTYGTIRIDIREDERDLYLTVEDNGMGMEPEEAQMILTSREKQNKNSMSGIGIINVHERLKMTYGEAYGLSYETEKGKYTRVTVHIPKEPLSQGEEDVYV